MAERVPLSEFLRDCLVGREHRPWPRYDLSAAKWKSLIERLAVEDWELLALWADPPSIHVFIRDVPAAQFFVISRVAADGRFESLGTVRPAAQRFERAARDLYGVEPEGMPDKRPWLDHGRWKHRQPLALRPVPTATPAGSPPDYAFLPVDGHGLHQIPVGPVHAGIIEPGHFRFHANGETVVRLEERLGWVHKGIEGLMQRKPLAEAAKLAARVSGDSTVAHALAFARAVEAAADTKATARADYIRAIMAELERIANHVNDFGAVCNDASFIAIHAGATALRERVLRASQAAFGHRLMMDCVVPGGVAADLGESGRAAIATLVADFRAPFESLVYTYLNKPSLRDRTVGTGILSQHLAHRFAAGGYVGRASGRNFDARRSPGYPPYDAMEFEVPVLPEGDVHARVMIRIREIRQSLKLLGQLLERLPDGAVSVPIVPRTGEGVALVEGFRGEIMTWVRLTMDGTVGRCYPRDPSALQWPLLEAVVEGNIVADFPLCNKSFNCSYSGHDL
jgi:Ni,Fe-hydrogenase III large subunit